MGWSDVTVANFDDRDVVLELVVTEDRRLVPCLNKNIIFYLVLDETI